MNNSLQKTISDFLICDICKENMKKPIYSKCNHNFCKDCILISLFCSICNKKLNKTDLTQNPKHKISKKSNYELDFNINSKNSLYNSDLNIYDVIELEEIKITKENNNYKKIIYDHRIYCDTEMYEINNNLKNLKIGKKRIYSEFVYGQNNIIEDNLLKKYPKLNFSIRNLDSYPKNSLDTFFDNFSYMFKSDDIFENKKIIPESETLGKIRKFKKN